MVIHEGSSFVGTTCELPLWHVCCPFICHPSRCGRSGSPLVFCGVSGVLCVLRFCRPPLASAVVLDFFGTGENLILGSNLASRNMNKKNKL